MITYTKLTNIVAFDVSVHYLHAKEIKPSTTLCIQYTTVAKGRKLILVDLLHKGNSIRTRIVT